MPRPHAPADHQRILIARPRPSSLSGAATECFHQGRRRRTNSGTTLTSRTAPPTTTAPSDPSGSGPRKTSTTYPMTMVRPAKAMTPNTVTNARAPLGRARIFTRGSTPAAGPGSIADATRGAIAAEGVTFSDAGFISIRPSLLSLVVPNVHGKLISRVAVRSVVEDLVGAARADDAQAGGPTFDSHDLAAVRAHILANQHPPLGT